MIKGRDMNRLAGSILYLVPVLLIVLQLGCSGTPPSESIPGSDLETGLPDDQPEPPTAVAIIADAELAAQSGDYRLAAELLTGLLENDPGNIEALRLLARVYSADGKTEPAASTWRKVAELDPSDPDAAYEVGIGLARMEKWDELRVRMMQTESLGTADERHYLLIGQAGMERGYRDEAEKYLLKAGDIELATALLGKLYYGRGRTADSEKAFKKTLRMNPENYIANLHMGYISYNRGNRRTALGYYEKAYRSDPNDPLACISLASLHEKLSDNGKAIEYFSAALSLKKIPRPEKKKAYVSLSRLLVKTGQLNRVYSVVQLGLAEFPSSGGLFFYWGEALLRHGRNAEAKDKFKKAANDPSWKKPALERFHSIR